MRPTRDPSRWDRTKKGSASSNKKQRRAKIKAEPRLDSGTKDTHATAVLHAGSGNRKRANLKAKSGGRRTKRGWFWRWTLRLVLLICILSALPMLYLRYFDPPTSSFIELNKLNHNRNILHTWVDIEEVSLYFPNAVIASEDQQFPYHHGFDLKQIKLVLEESENGPSRGASTITQQTVKNLFLWPDRSFVRKGLEAWLAVWMELIVPKQRIIELYINFAQFGRSVFGVGAASQYYFQIDAKDLTPEQSALIAAALPTPSRSNPAKPSEYLQERADYILDQMPRVGGRRMVRELAN